jgi:hypothetical protein
MKYKSKIIEDYFVARKENYTYNLLTTKFSIKKAKFKLKTNNFKIFKLPINSNNNEILNNVN